MKNKKSAVMVAIAIICLCLIGAIFLKGWLKRQNNINTQKELGKILGEAVQFIPDTNPTSAFEKIIQDKIHSTFQETKETLTQKAVEVESAVVKLIEKEVSNLTASQVEALKVQICKDLGVIVITPTITP